MLHWFSHALYDDIDDHPSSIRCYIFFSSRTPHISAFLVCLVCLFSSLFFFAAFHAHCMYDVIKRKWSKSIDNDIIILSLYNVPFSFYKVCIGTCGAVPTTITNSKRENFGKIGLQTQFVIFSSSSFCLYHSITSRRTLEWKRWKPSASRTYRIVATHHFKMMLHSIHSSYHCSPCVIEPYSPAARAKTFINTNFH